MKNYKQLEKIWNIYMVYEHHHQNSLALESDIESNVLGFDHESTEYLCKRFKTNDWMLAYKRALKYHKKELNKKQKQLKRLGVNQQQLWNNFESAITTLWHAGDMPVGRTPYAKPSLTEVLNLYFGHEVL